MLTIKLYISVLSLVFLFTALVTRGIGLLDGIVVVCAVLYLILDSREELKALRALKEQLDSLE